MSKPEVDDPQRHQSTIRLPSNVEVWYPPQLYGPKTVSGPSVTSPPTWRKGASSLNHSTVQPPIKNGKIADGSGNSAKNPTQTKTRIPTDYSKDVFSTDEGSSTVCSTPVSCPLKSTPKGSPKNGVRLKSRVEIYLHPSQSAPVQADQASNFQASQSSNQGPNRSRRRPASVTRGKPYERTMSPATSSGANALSDSLRRGQVDCIDVTEAKTRYQPKPSVSLVTPAPEAGDLVDYKVRAGVTRGGKRKTWDSEVPASIPVETVSQSATVDHARLSAAVSQSGKAGGDPQTSSDDMDVDSEITGASVDGTPMDVDQVVLNVRRGQDYLGPIPKVNFDILDVEMTPAEVKPKRCLILDTNIFVHDHCKIWNNLLNFLVSKEQSVTDVQIRIPYVVLMELDNLKTKRGSISWAARRASRDINDRFKERDNRFVGQTLKDYKESRDSFSPKDNDDCILCCCLQALKDFPNDLYFVTNDRNFETKVLIQKTTIHVMNGTGLINAIDSYNKPPEPHSPPALPSPDPQSVVAAASKCRQLYHCVEKLLLRVLSEFLLKRLQQVFKDLWQDMTGDCRFPWPDIGTVVELIEKRRSALFMDVFKRNDEKLFTDLISPDNSQWTVLRSPLEEMVRLENFLRKALAVVKFIAQLKGDIIVLYKNLLDDALALLNHWEGKRSAVSAGEVPVETLWTLVTDFLAGYRD